ncbi:hypothetical protein MLD38_028953 [Melastoma candidum]|uniref:Uncharacterized protein n=1 Tax=Melastoma candidum TaxID=119954 RepID=A0ACB9N3X0_9MYRT|nr:hypothetical protein MLD38_028953 [Melastoma candidum]
MVDSYEIEDQVDLDEDNNYMDDEPEEQSYEDGSGGANDEHSDDAADENVVSGVRDEKEEPINEEDGSDSKEKSAEGGERHEVSSNDGDKEKYKQLLSLPPHGSEVFIGGLPRDILEEEIRELCEPVGDVFEVRLVKDKSTGESKGYAFVAYRASNLAQKSIELLHNKEFKGKTLRCSLSESKNRLFIGNVPKAMSEDEFRRIVEEVGPGVETIELIKDPVNPGRNRGFAFILYYNNACADYSRQKMASVNFKLDGNTPTVTWADPKSTSDHAAASQVKALYVKNIPDNTTTEQLKELFQRHGEVTKVVMPPSKTGSSKRDFGFVHYADRSSALKAVKETEKYEIDGTTLEVVLAKPQSEKKPDVLSSGYTAQQFPPQGYGGFIPGPYGSAHGGYGAPAPLAPPMIYGRGPMPSGMHMVPMVLPDGRIGYVLQQPGVQMPPSRPRRIDRNNGSSGRGSPGDDGTRGRRFRPY